MTGAEGKQTHLRLILADDGTGLVPRNTQRFGVGKLVTDEVGRGGQGSAQAAEETLASLVAKSEAYIARSEDDGLIRSIHLVDDNLAVRVDRCGILDMVSSVS